MFSSNGSQVASSAANYIEDVFSTYLYTGNGSTQTITNGIDLSGEGGLVWCKARSVSKQHCLLTTDIPLPTNPYYPINFLATNSDSALQDIYGGGGTGPWASSYLSNGFSLYNNENYNESGTTYASWTFRKQPKFFDVVTYTGTDSVQNIAHSLGSVPGCIIVKKLNDTSIWSVYHTSIGAGNYLTLNTTDAAGAASSLWNSTTPTSTQFTVGTSGSTNGSGNTFVAYLFAHDAGGFGLSGSDNVISCGSYTGTGAVGNKITLGYEPQWLLIKRTDTANSWYLFDTMRGLSLTQSLALLPNGTNSDLDYSASFQLNADGVTQNNVNAAFNASGGTYIYIAIRRGPMKVPTDATKVFAPVIGVSSSSAPYMTDLTSFTVDAQLMGNRTGIENKYESSRLQGTGKILYTNTTVAEVTGDYPAWDRQTGVGSNVGSSDFSSYITYNFRRAPSTFDVVCYTGTGSTTAYNHNLGVAPELIIVKSRNDVNDWAVYSSALGNTKNLRLNTTAAASTALNLWASTTPSATTFTTNGTYNLVGGGTITYVAYLFATCAGVSKVGSYTGTGTTQAIDCGFAAGARFVVIKRTDSTGDWYVWDTARGIVSGNDPYLLLNSTTAEVTSTDYVDPYSAGFELSTTALTTVNVLGGSYIYLAIA